MLKCVKGQDLNPCLESSPAFPIAKLIKFKEMNSPYGTFLFRTCVIVAIFG